MVELSNIQVGNETAPVTEPVSLDDIKTWLKIDFADDDATLTSMGVSARKTIEKLLNLHLIAKTVTLDVCVTKCNEIITLPFCNSMSDVVANQLDDQDQQTLLASGTDYFIRGNTIRIDEGRYSVSYTTVPGTIPEDLKEAIKMEVAERYANRGENQTTTGLSEGAKTKALPYQILWL